jgi:hypothetical protein
MADITFIYTKRTRNNCSNYRGISIIGAAVKEFGRVIRICRCSRRMNKKGKPMLNKEGIPTSAVVKNDSTLPYGFTTLCVIEQKVNFLFKCDCF